MEFFLVVPLSAGVTLFVNHYFFTPEKQKLEVKVDDGGNFLAFIDGAPKG